MLLTIDNFNSYMSISLLLLFFMTQVNGRYSSSMVVELPQTITTLSLIPVDCHIFIYSSIQVDCHNFGGMVHALFPFPKLTWFTSLFWLILADLKLNLKIWHKKVEMVWVLFPPARQATC